MSSERQVLWEYKVIWMDMGTMSRDTLSSVVEGIDRDLNSLGAKGWELVFVQPLGGKYGHDVAYLLKRMKSDK
jgi:hypothetical protein